MPQNKILPYAHDYNDFTCVYVFARTYIRTSDTIYLRVPKNANFPFLAAPRSRFVGDAQFDLIVPRLRLSKLGSVRHSFLGLSTARLIHRHLHPTNQIQKKILAPSTLVICVVLMWLCRGGGGGGGGGGSHGCGAYCLF